MPKKKNRAGGERHVITRLLGRSPPAHRDRKSPKVRNGPGPPPQSLLFSPLYLTCTNTDGMHATLSSHIFTYVARDSSRRIREFFSLRRHLSPLLRCGNWDLCLPRLSLSSASLLLARVQLHAQPLASRPRIYSRRCHALPPPHARRLAASPHRHACVLRHSSSASLA